MRRQDRPRIDVAGLVSRIDLAALIVADGVVLKRSGGHEWKGCCPFHAERTASFTVNVRKRFYHCFGCGQHGDAIGWVMHYHGLDFPQACEHLGAGTLRHLPAPQRTALPAVSNDPVFVPLMPAPPEAPQILPGVRIRLPNPKRGHPWTMTPTRADPYRNARGQVLGYVLRVDFEDGEKVTPQVTWCVAPDGSIGWTVWRFPSPRPLLGLDDLAARPDAPVLLVEGEKCRAVGAAALHGMVVMSWPGGGKALEHVDWMPLRGRRVLLWGDADLPGLQAMLGYEIREGSQAGKFRDGVAQHLALVGVDELAFVDLDQDDVTGLAPGIAKGWDIADARLVDGWSARQLVAFLADKARPLSIVPSERRAA